MDKLIEKYPVLLFSKTGCQFCMEVQRTLASYGVKFAQVNVNKLPHGIGPLVQNRLKEIGGFRTVPHLFVDAKSRGDCTGIKSQEKRLEFQAYIGKYIDWTRVASFHDRRVPKVPLFYFPDTVNGNVAQCSGLFTAIYCLLCCIFYEDTLYQPWAVLALAIDFNLRLIGGSIPSPIGMISMCVCSFFPPRFVAGKRHVTRVVRILDRRLDL